MDPNVSHPDISDLGGWLYWYFTALRHFTGHFGRGLLTYPHCSWGSLLPFLNQRKGENGCRNYFMTNLHKRMLPDVRIAPATVPYQADADPTELPRPAFPTWMFHTRTFRTRTFHTRTFRTQTVRCWTSRTRTLRTRTFRTRTLRTLSFRTWTFWTRTFCSWTLRTSTSHTWTFRTRKFQGHLGPGRSRLDISNSDVLNLDVSDPYDLQPDISHPTDVRTRPFRTRMFRTQTFGIGTFRTRTFRTRPTQARTFLTWSRVNTVVIGKRFGRRMSKV